MAVNPVDYESIVLNGVPYGTGSVWASVLWDMYWELVEVYGWSPDLINGDKGNNIALQLVMDGMKLQPCNPTMVDGRDAILMADEINNAGANACLIWEVFANRGIGFGAEDGELVTRFDNVQSLEKLPACIETVKLSKTMTPLIEAGEEIEIELVVSNDKPAEVTGLQIADQLPEGLTVVPGSANKNFTLEGGAVNFDLASLSTGASDTIRYRVISSADLFSQSIFLDDMENGEDQWFHFHVEEEEGVVNDWGLDDLFANSGTNSFGVADIGQRSKAYLQFDQPVQLVG
ncbi:MAG: M36 family metallopeptidase, partial [Bacteroidota bacterium]